MVVSEPIHKKALAILFQEWPEGLFYSDLLSRLSKLTQRAIKNTDEDLLCDFLLQSYSDGMLEFRLFPPACIKRISEKRKVSKFVRHQARNNDFVTNQRHVNITIGNLGKHLLPLLDGTKDLNFLTQQLEQLANEKTLATSCPSRISESKIRQALENFRRASLLIA